MNQKIIVLILFLSLISTSYSQTISGTVHDTRKGQPLVGATVYINGSSIGTITNEEGHFFIKANKKINGSLVRSYVGYTSVVSENPDANKAIEIILQPDLDNLNEVFITTDSWSREKKIREFKKQFLGDTKAGKSCFILNEDDIYLNYDEQNKTLLANSDTPIIIRNNLLGYTITYDLQAFEAKYDQPKKKHPLCKSVYYDGSSFYKNLSENDVSLNRFIKNRQKEYNGSFIHFMRVLVTGNLRKEGFKLFKGTRPITKDNVFTILQESDYYIIRMKQNFLLKYKDQKHSLVTKEKLEEPFIIHPYGAYVPPKSIRFSGHLAYDRVGNALPLDYTPPHFKEEETTNE